MIKKLSELSPGASGKIHSIADNELLLKLMEMGCVPGEVIRLDQLAPWGGPISVTVSGYTLSLRINEAEAIFIETNS
jgi:Fe2+ transport system protein FeoA